MKEGFERETTAGTIGSSVRLIDCSTMAVSNKASETKELFAVEGELETLSSRLSLTPSTLLGRMEFEDEELDNGADSS